MRLEIIQFIVPLAFLAVWALTALLNRDAQPLPPRPISGSSPEGLPRGGSAVGRMGASGPARYLGAADRTPAPAEPKSASRWSDSMSGERSAAERRARAAEGVVIIDSDTRGPLAGSGGSGTASASRGARAQPSRRGARSRSNALSSSARSPEPAKPRALSGLVSQSLADGKARPLAITPLGSPLVPIDLPLAQSILPSVTGAAHTSQPPAAVTSADIRSRFASADKLREVAILSEILQPPVSLRRTRRIG